MFCVTAIYTRTRRIEGLYNLNENIQFFFSIPLKKSIQFNPIEGVAVKNCPEKACGFGEKSLFLGENFKMHADPKSTYNFGVSSEEFSGSPTNSVDLIELEVFALKF